MAADAVAGDEGTACRAPSAELVRAYREAVQASLHEQLNTTEHDLVAGREELQRLSRRFVTLERRLQHQARSAEALRALDDPAASAGRELDRLLALPSVEGVEVHGLALHVLTQPVRILWDGARYDLGGYRIVLDLHGEVRIKSRDNLGPKPGWDHPHVQDGRPCLGNAREGVLKLIARYELGLAAQVLVGFLETYQPEGAYCAIEGWPRAHADG
jgi:hypothetical protein